MATEKQTDDAKIVKESQMIRLSATKVKPAMTAYLNAQGEMREHQGNMGDIIKNRVDAMGCNRKAFKLVAQMLRMSPEARDDFMRSLEQLVDIYGLKVQPDLVDIAEDGPKANGAAKPKKADAKPPKTQPDKADLEQADVASPAVN